MLLNAISDVNAEIAALQIHLQEVNKQLATVLDRARNER